MGTHFNSNALIKRFTEFSMFTKMSSFSNMVRTSLEAITFPSSIRTIAAYAFNNSSNLVDVEMNEGLTTLQSQCFWGCSFTQVYPSTITTIQKSVIGTNGPRSYSIICKATSVPSLGDAAYLNRLLAVYVPDESFDAYSTATNWSTVYNANKLKRKSDLPDELKKYWP